MFDLATKWLERYRRQAVERFHRLDAILGAMTIEPTDPTPTSTDKEPS